jgi:asparagine synthase (glutamine-hydrolysing)
VDCFDVPQVATGISGVTIFMSGIYGICEPGAQLQSHELEPMSLAMRLKEEQGEQPIGGDGALLSVAPGLSATSHDAAYGSFVAVDADLVNVSQLFAEHEKWHGSSIRSTAEVIAILYAQYGLSFVERLEGAFSLAVWDPQRQRLVLAIDRFGFKTLYWAADSARILFSSRLSAVACAKQHAEVAPASVMQFLVHSVVPAPLTIYKGIERLEPGTLLVYERQQTRKTRYWDLNYEASRKTDVKDLALELRETMRQAVHSHLHGCEPERTGAYLSGGTDSSSVVAFGSEVQSPFNTFSIYFENPRYDEIGFARTAAEHFHARHHQKCLQASDAVEAIPRIIEYYQEPFANSSAIGAYPVKTASMCSWREMGETSYSQEMSGMPRTGSLRFTTRSPQFFAMQ